MYQFTTPTINISIPSNYDVSNITDLVVTLAQGDTTLEKTLDDVTLDTTNNYITITLTQEETGEFATGTVQVQAHLKIGSTVYATQIMKVNMRYNLHQEEL